MKEGNNATYSFDYVDVMEAVAHDTDGPEPPVETVEAWLEKHEAALTEAMYCAGRDYIRQYWEAK